MSDLDTLERPREVDKVVRSNHNRRRTLLWIAVSFVLTVLVGVVWIGTRVLAVKASLERAQATVGSVQELVAAQNWHGIEADSAATS